MLQYPHCTGCTRRRRREYGDRIREVEYAVFTSLVFSTTGGMGKETAVAYKHLAELLAEKRKSEYGITLAWMRCILSFALIRSAVTAIRGSRTSERRDIATTDIELACKESGLQIWLAVRIEHYTLFKITMDAQNYRQYSFWRFLVGQIIYFYVFI